MYFNHPEQTEQHFLSNKNGDTDDDKKKLILGKYKTLEEVPREVSIFIINLINP